MATQHSVAAQASRADYGTVPRCDSSGGGELLEPEPRRIKRRTKTNYVLTAYPAFLLIAVLVLLISSASLQQQQVERWSIYEVVLKGPSDEPGGTNPFEVLLNATFVMCASNRPLKCWEPRQLSKFPSTKCS